MKATGLTRNADRIGRVVLPKEIRNEMGIGDQDSLEFFIDGDAIVLRKYEPGCIFCGSVTTDFVLLQGKQVCRRCIREMKLDTDR